jgi:hypothetical protein
MPVRAKLIEESLLHEYRSYSVNHLLPKMVSYAKMPLSIYNPGLDASTSVDHLLPNWLVQDPEYHKS